MAYLRWKDKRRPEPLAILILATAAGVASVGAALLGYGVLDGLGRAATWSTLAGPWRDAIPGALAIGRRGQNVRLASELIACRIDIKSESSVKDEVADALARMLKSAMGEEETVATDLDFSSAGIDEETEKSIRDAGFTTIDSILDADISELAAIESVDSESLLHWAREEKNRRTADDVGELFAAVPAGAESSTMNDQDFMAALSKAFQDSEPISISDSDAEEGEKPSISGSDD